MIKFEKHVLSNGLKVIVQPDKSTPLACMNILYDVGARDEHPDKTGFAHLFEHLMFGGSTNIPSYDDELQKVGGENNAFTTNDITNYYITLPYQNIETAFWLESDRMLSLAFSEKSLEVQRNVVIEEFKQRYLNQPYGDVWLLLRPLAYKVHPYQWDTIGKEIAHIENAKMQDVKDFFTKFYNPSNAIMVLSGNIDTDKVLKLSEKWFGGIPSVNKNARNLPKEPKQQEARELYVEREVPFDAIYKTFHMPKRNDPNFYTCDLISDLLSRGNSSRLYNNLVKDKKLFSEINAYTTGDFDEGMFVISGKLSDGVDFNSANKSILQELDQLKEKNMDENELVKVKNKVESTLVFSEMDILTRATNIAIAEVLGDANMVNKEVDNYFSVTGKRVKEQANLVFDTKNQSTLFYKSKK